MALRRKGRSATGKTVQTLLALCTLVHKTLMESCGNKNDRVNVPAVVESKGAQPSGKIFKFFYQKKTVLPLC